MTKLPVESRSRSNPTSVLSLRVCIAAGVAVASIGVGGCSKDSIVASIGAPGTTVRATVSDVRVRYRYVDAFVLAGAFKYRFFFPDQDPCRTILDDPKDVSFVWLGTMGRLTQGDERCSPVGVLSLQAWRDRAPRRSREPLPRGQAVFREVYRDDDMVIVRGRFPLAGLANWAGGQDTLAILPNSEVCAGFLSRGVASMEFRASGADPLVLIDGGNLCPIIGFAQPLPGS